MQNLLETFRSIGNLSPENEILLLNAIKKVEVPAKTILHEAGKICDSIYFVEKGIARTFYYKNGKDITYWIAPENEFVGAMASFFSREPSNKWVETIQDCVLWKFEHSRLEELFSSSHDLEKVARLFANHGISLLEKRFDAVHFNTAQERYEILIAEQPNILQRVPLGMVASFLGITQETLSRVRAKK